MDLYYLAKEIDNCIAVINLSEDLDNKEKLCYYLGRLGAYSAMLQIELNERNYVDISQ